MRCLILLCSLFTFTITIVVAAGNPNLLADHLSINCGSTSTSTSVLTGGEWLADVYPKFTTSITLKGSSSTTTTTTLNKDGIITADPVPYKTARISRSQFYYTFHFNPGQKYIRLHFNPASYHGFESFNDFFTVEAGPFTLLTNFSPSLTARAFALHTVVKEYCISTQESQPFNIVFSPGTPIPTHPSQDTYAFINGIEIISLPSSLSYCHDGDIGVQALGHKSVIYIDNSTALEMVNRRNIKWDSVSSCHDIHCMFGMWASILKHKAINKVNDITWKTSVDVGFRYLIRLHFYELGLLKMAQSDHKDFILVINHMIAITSADILRETQDRGILGHKDYIVMVNGDKREGKRDIFISLHPKDEFLDGQNPLEGFEIFKLSNHDNSLANPNPLPLTRDSPSQNIIQILLSVLGRRNATATVVIAIVSLVNVVVHMLREIWGANITEKDNKPLVKAKRLCRRFSLVEIQSATDNFHDVFIIGRGGFGKVYKGFIDNSQQTVAIKRLKSNSKQGKREFLTEIETLSELRHVNLVSLIGYCNEQREMILVYEYMPCGTLADHLYKLARKDKTCYSLSWKQRLKICIGAGRALDYLHTGNGIIHRDMKASNILLDEKFSAKVSDFGLAKNESASESHSQASTNLKGTFGYIDPDYIRTRKLTTKSDTYSFGVVLLEVLCGRPAVEPWVEEDKRSLTMWARDNISNGEVDQIVDPSLTGEILADSLKAFVSVAERCLHDDPKKRPTIAHVIINLEFALEQQENEKSLGPTKIPSVADFFPFTDKAQQENANSLVPNEITNVADILSRQENAKSSVPNQITNVAEMPSTNITQQETAKSLLPNEITSVVDAPAGTDRSTILSVSTRQPTIFTSNVQNFTSPLKERTQSKMIDDGKKDWRKTTIHKLSRLWKTTKLSKLKDLVSVSKSGLISSKIVSGDGAKLKNSSSKTSSALPSTPRIEGEILQSSNLKSFTLSDLKAATRNFRPDSVLGEGGFGCVFKGWIDEHSLAASRPGSGMVVAVKRLNQEGWQGHKEWLAEINYLGQLRHPNLVRLIGYCLEDDHRLLVYEFMPKGSMENHLFKRGSYFQPLSWSLRMTIALGAARGLAFLHCAETKVIYRDFKTSNILLDSNYNAKLSDFGLARDGPTGDKSHVSTRIMGTYGYAAPEYLSTGHLTAKSDVYGFGVVLLELLTGKRVTDNNRPMGEHNLVEWAKPYLPNKRKIFHVLDARLEGQYSVGRAVKAANLALQCLSMDARSRPNMEEVVIALEELQDSKDTSKNDH